MTDARLRTRSATALFVGVATSAMGYTMTVAVLPLVAEDLLGSPRWSGVPAALATTGVATGTTWLAMAMARAGRRRALAWGYWASMASAVLAAAGAAAGLFPVMVIAIFCFGAGYSSSRLSRYAAADLYDPEHRSRAIGWNVWAATIGSVVGPLMLETTRRAGTAAGLTGMVGPFLLASVTFGVAGLAVWLVYSPVDHAERPAQVDHERRTSPAAARLAVVSLVVGQVVMVLVMTMTPIHIRHGGGSLDWVGIVFAAHTFGMFAFSPIAGILSDRIGRVPMIVMASGLLAAAGLLSAISDVGSWYLAVALFLLGLGWCFSFVAGSALLTESVPHERRLRVQGIADSMVWGSAAVAGLSSGFLLASLGYPTLGYIGAVLAAMPLFFLRRFHATSTAAARPR